MATFRETETNKREEREKSAEKRERERESAEKREKKKRASHWSVCLNENESVWVSENHGGRCCVGSCCDSHH